MKRLRMLTLVFAFAAICVGDALGASPSDEAAPSTPSVQSVSPDFHIAQAGPPPSGDGRVTKDDIRWLWAHSERQREESERLWSEPRNDLSAFKNTVVAILGGIIIGILIAMLVQNYCWGKEP